jgi:hypothetical protein
MPSSPSDHHEAFITALRLAASEGVVLRVKTKNGWTHRITPPIVIGGDFVQFASPASRRPVVVQLEDVVDFERLEAIV